MRDADAVFANYVENPTRVPLAMWMVLRGVVLAGFFAVVVWGFVDGDAGLRIFWGMLVPVLPAVWLLAPGLWRNTCPLATANQLPRILGFSRNRTVPTWLSRISFSIAAGAFVVLVLTRKVSFNASGIATSVLLLVVIGTAFVGGVVFKGKSGWCSAFCPLLPIQRLYGQAPVARVPNAHCQPCVGCTKNCFDFNPGVAYVADQHDTDERFRLPRRLFAGAFPGLVVAYFTVGTAEQLGAWEMYATSAVWILAGIAAISLLDAHLPLPRNAAPPLFGALGFSLFYWYGFPVVSNAWDAQFGISLDALIWPGRVLAMLAALAFFIRSIRVEQLYVEETTVQLGTRAAVPAAVRSGSTGAALVKIADRDGDIGLPAPGEPTLLEVIEAAKLSIQSGCRMGVCGADPVAIVSGYEALTPPLPAEVDTLKRLGLGAPNRLACMARVTGTCSVSLRPDTNALPEAEAPTFDPDPTVERVVIIGNGVAGITAADHVRRNHPTCSIDVVAREPHALYNRMAISTLIYNPKGVEDLRLLPADWYERNGVRQWLNTTVDRIERETHDVVLRTGERLPYDRLVLATGSSAFMPQIEGGDLPGVFSLRSAEHAVRVRSYCQDQGIETVFVAGGGLLGLEAAYSMRRLGMRVTVGERSERLLRRQIDARASEILAGFFRSEGIEVRTDVEVVACLGDDRLRAVRLGDGEEIATGVLLVAAGIRPNVQLAEAAGLAVGRGVLVDAALRTSDPDIYAIGDAAEFEGQLWGLWTIAVAQGEIAAANLAGGARLYRGDLPTTILKGAGIDLISFGRFEPEDGDEVTIGADSDTPPHYAKVVRRNGEVVGGTFIESGDAAVAAQAEYAETIARRDAAASV